MSSKRQTVFFLPVDPRYKGHQDLAKIEFNKPRRAQYLHSAWKRHQYAVYWVDINLAIRKGLTFYQTRSNAIILQGTLPASCIPKVVRLKMEKSLYEKSYMSPRPEGKFHWVLQLINNQKEKLFDSHEEKFLNTQRSPNKTQPIPKPICDRSGQPDSTQDVFVVKGETSRSQEINDSGFSRRTWFFRSGKPDKLSENIRVKRAHDGTGQPVEQKSSGAQ